MPKYSTEQEAVRNLQRYLRRLSQEENDLLPVPVDGIYGDRTREAVEEFQRMMGLPVTGVADRRTWELLFAEYERLQQEADRRISPDLFPRTPLDYQTAPGESHAFIALLQFMLNELNLTYETLPLLDLTGTMDAKTSSAVQEFQRISRLPQTGQVNRNTWNRLSEEYNQYAT